ncbi:MAG TPA: hypothetical protein VFT59_04465, partial [Candidatus Saccharimonadales bacterium]|nr:hypothetical protein [Candidatus Saccharimonadales bacterium]
MISNIPRKYKVWLEFAGLALVIMLPLLLPGYVLTLDLVFAPQAPIPELTSHDFPLKAIIWLFYLILPGDVVEKIILFSALLFSGVGTYSLIRVMPHPHPVQEGSWRLAAYAAGVLYMINPFIYARFMAGQWMIILGYALLPFFIRSLLIFLHQPSLKNSLMIAGWAVSISIASLHY